MRDQIDALLGKDMTRKEFLQHIGSGLLILFGFSTILKALTQQKTASRGQGLSYGSSAYGGTSKR